ncbi:MAG TPA: HEPN domain-containing protein [Candidatus Brocadiia bacterium]|nr:HEPN domain-containing protein [Candidatus Brocadiia bacterium]
MKAEAEEHFRKAQNLLGACRTLMDAGYHADAVSRAYYCMFHAAKAVLVEDGIERSSHRAVISAFGLFFVKGGRFDRDMQESFWQAFNMRSDGDYAPCSAIQKEDAEQVAEAASNFLMKCLEFLQSRT